jgi:hypothetical protein
VNLINKGISKREINKELMFNKIMPTRLLDNFDNFDDFDEDSTKDFYTTLTQDENNQVDIIDNNASNISEIKKTDNTNQIVLTNIIEKIVMSKIDRALEKFKICKCYFCKQQIIARTLNELMPKYVLLKEDEIDEFVANEDDTEVVSMLVKTIINVKSNPIH